MQRVKREIPIVRYLMLWCSVIVLVVMSVLLVVINVITNRAVLDRVHWELSWQMRRAANQIVSNDGIPVFSEFFNKNHMEYFYLIVDENGSYLNGFFPQEYLITEPIVPQNDTMRKITMGEEQFYVLDLVDLLEERGDLTGNYALRGIVRVRDVSTIYECVRTISYFSIVGVVLALGMFALVLQKRVSAPLAKMCKAAEQISRDLDFTEKIAYDGHFYELDTLLNAYNHLLERMHEVVLRQEQFNSDVSHELRTPIAVIRAQCELSKEKALKENDSEALEALDVIERQSGKMNQMVEQLLNLSRLEQKRIPCEFEDIDLVFVAESVCEDQEYLCGDKYQFVYDLHSVDIHADVNLIMLVVRNLVSNAVKYSPEGSEIIVRCGIKKDKAFLSVQDQGIGIAKENRKKIFEHFYRTEEARNSEGFGLGLTLALKIVEYHGGTIHVESECGQGSTFTMFLPRAK